MIAHGATLIDLHSARLSENRGGVSLWLELADGSLISVHIDASELLLRGTEIGRAVRTPPGMTLQ